MSETTSQIVGIRMDKATIAALDKLVSDDKHKSRSACVKHLILQRAAENESEQKKKDWLVSVLTSDDEIRSLIISIVKASE